MGVKGITLAVGLALAAALFAAPDEAKLTPAQEAAINLMKERLGAGFTVKRMGVLVVATDLEGDAAAAVEKSVIALQDALYRDFFVKRPTGVFKVALFKDNVSLRANAKKLAVKSAVMPAGGFYLPYERVICAEMDAGGMWLAQHEITHALLHSDLGREDWPKSTVPPWIDEGIAMLMESAPIKDGSLVIKADWRLPQAVALAQAGKMPKLRDLMKMDFAAYNTPGPNRMLYDVEARAFLLWLHEKGQLMSFYKAYRSNLASDPTGVKFVEKAMQKTLDEIEAEWLDWLKAKAAAGPAAK